MGLFNKKGQQSLPQFPELPPLPTLERGKVEHDIKKVLVKKVKHNAKEKKKEKHKKTKLDFVKKKDKLRRKVIHKNIKAKSLSSKKTEKFSRHETLAKHKPAVLAERKISVGVKKAASGEVL